jgi:acyl-CoA synthetase (AMP-forming)/AMP-acid ligase II/1-acyl-sn-glycerol-3-phosphate acyltransferase/acyl carrier protein
VFPIVDVDHGVRLITVTRVIVRNVLRSLLGLRYRIDLRGLDALRRRGPRGILFLANHPALIDPLIVMTSLNRYFAPWALADRDQISAPGVSWLAKQANVVPIPDIKVHGPEAKVEVEAAVGRCIEHLKTGGNMLLYPSGHIYRTRYENLRGNSGVEDILRAAPDIRVVLLRTRGLWGSSFSLINGEFPNLGRVAREHMLNLLESGLFFMPRRQVSIEFHEPEDLPRRADRETLNTFIENWFNDDAPPAKYVPYTPWSRSKREDLPDPEWGEGGATNADVPATVRQRVFEKLTEAIGNASFQDHQSLSKDLGLDSLARTELLTWIGQEFGQPVPEGDAVKTVGDLLLAACGEVVVTRPTQIDPPPKRWFESGKDRRATISQAPTIAQAFLDAACAAPDRMIIADQMRGARSYRDLITAILLLRPHVARLAGERIGIMLPASVGATTLYMTALFAEKTPLMLNWTTGTRSIAHALEITGTRHILTSQALVSRLESTGTDFGPAREKFVFLEALAEKFTTGQKLNAAAQSRLTWGALERAKPPEQAVVLVTSGSESLPKAVPLTHTNILTNLRDLLSVVEIRQRDRLIGFLPPFHSFGLSVTTVLPLIAGIPTVYHPKPNDAFIIARLILAYGVTIMLGTPTFLRGILRATNDAELLKSLRLAVTGAEKCPESTYDLLAERCPQATVLEGYGITECSPVVSVNRVENAKHGTIGIPLPSVETAIVDVETDAPAGPGAAGMLLVRGPSIFAGYLGSDVANPFVEHEGQSWYRTGDLVRPDGDGVLTFEGRLKRFVKIGGEMVSLPAIEETLLKHAPSTDGEGPPLAVVANSGESRPEVILFSTQDMSRQQANQWIRESGLSGLHYVSQVRQIAELPLLGNGKTDYRALQTLLSEEST